MYASAHGLWSAPRVPVRCSGPGWRRKLPTHLILNPAIGPFQTVLERDRRLPTQDLPQASIVGVAPADALRTRHVLLSHANPGDRRDDIDQLINGHHAILPEVQWLP